MVRKVSCIDWRAAEEGFGHGASSARLMREHLRRMAVWVRELQKARPAPFFGVAQRDRWPFFDLAPYVEPSARPDGEAAAVLGAFLAEHASSPLTGRICRAALNWASLSPRSLARFGGLPDPYEPLLLVFERSGAFWIENGFVDFAAHRVRLGSWEDHVAAEPLLSLDGAVLDAMDRA
ncbi:hypothetical protein ACFV6G_35455 [Streptomyces lavendulae]|uniref:hypothetical protein n=1 Tax=Streptomyces lavendulae TaxID=1914 RepID=UPI0036B28C48